MAKKNESMKGIIMALVGIFFVYWAQTHSPKSGLGNIVKNELSGSYTMSESWYYITLILGIVGIIYGGYTIYKSSK